MLAIKDIVSGEFFDIPSLTSLEIERNNPYIGTDEISGENTLPINMFYTDKNYRLIQYHGNFYKRNRKLQIAVEIYDNTNYKYTGTFVIQQHTGNMNVISNTVWVGIVTFNASSFFQDAKNKFLHEIDLGGVHTYPWTTSDPNDNSGGFWQHIHAARTPDAFDYVFYPIINPSWATFTFADEFNVLYLGMNLLGVDNYFHHPVGDFVLGTRNTYSIVPCIYVKFILNKIFEAIGWTLTGEILQDPGFKKLTLVGTRAIPYASVPPDTIDVVHNENAIFDLKDYVTEGVTLYKFMIDLKNRFGWKFTFNSNTRTANLSSLKGGISTGTKDWTAYVVSDYKAEYKEAVTNFSLINNIDENDSFPLSADTSRVTKIPAVGQESALPASNTQDEGVICYCYKENTWFQNAYDYTLGTLAWTAYSHNVDSYLEPDPSVRIESDISTMPTLKHKNYDNDRYILVPHADYLGNPGDMRTDFVNLGMRVLFFHGFKNDSEGVPYPYASCHNSDYEGHDDLTPWSISYRREYAAINNGVYDYWYKPWLKYIQTDDIRTFRLQLPAYILSQFNWESNIRINDVDFIPVSYKEILPYPGIVEFKMKRVN